MEEIWKDVPGYEERYQVSNIGRIRSKDILLHKSDGKKELRKGRIIKLQINTNGYPVYLFSHPLIKKRKLISIHRIVAQAFIPNPYNKPCIDHINRCRTDNRVENLRWCTLKENMNNTNTIAHLKVCRPDFKHSIETRKKLSKIQIGKIIPESTRMKIREKGRPVSQYSKDGYFIKHHRSASYAGEELNVSHNHIGQCCRGIRKSAGGFRWKYKDEYIEGETLPPIAINRRKGIATEKQKLAAKENLKYARDCLKRKIIQMDLNSNRIKEFNSISEAARELNLDAGSITRCCQGKYKQTKGFKFKYGEN